MNLPLTPNQFVGSPEAFRGQICALEAVMHQMTDRQVTMETFHHFARGVYAREIFIPKGVTLVGKIHKYEHLNFITQGDITVVTEDGPRRIKAPAVIVSPPGVKRAGYAHEDTRWITVHPTRHHDVDKIEKEHIAPTFNDVPRIGALKRIGDGIRRLISKGVSK